MIREEVTYAMPDGMGNGYIFRHEDGKARPGVLHLTDIMGIRPSHLGMAERMAGEGYTVFVPNVFYRRGPGPFFDEAPKERGEEVREIFRQNMESVPPENAQKDMVAYVDYFAGLDSVKPGPMGAVGYCLTGSWPMRAAAAQPDKVVACASFHGVRLCRDEPLSPHLDLPKIKAELYFGHGIEDAGCPAEEIERLGGELAKWGGTYENETYDGFYHGWTTPDAKVYDKGAAERAYAKLTGLFARHLG